MKSNSECDTKKAKLYSGGDRIVYWSKNRKDVENFILGVRAANTVMSELVKSQIKNNK